MSSNCFGSGGVAQFRRILVDLGHGFRGPHQPRRSEIPGSPGMPSSPHTTQMPGVRKHGGIDHSPGATSRVSAQEEICSSQLDRFAAPDFLPTAANIVNNTFSVAANPTPRAERGINTWGRVRRIHLGDPCRGHPSSSVQITDARMANPTRSQTLRFLAYGIVRSVALPTPCVAWQVVRSLLHRLGSPSRSGLRQSHSPRFLGGPPIT